MQVANSHVVVTGGASGLGAGTAALLAERGAHVTLLDRNEPGVIEQAATLSKLGAGKVHGIAVDVVDGDAVRAALQSAMDTLGPIRGLVHCAGIEHVERVVGKNGAHDLSAFKRVIDVNVIGTFNVLRLVAEFMSKNELTAEGERGAIVMTASVAAFDGQIGQAAYSASKGAVAAMTLPIARDLARSAIRVLSIAPGIFDTPLLARLPENVRQSLEALVPFPSRLGKPSEFAHLAVAMLENTMLNGEVVRLDGALRMPAK